MKRFVESEACLTGAITVGALVAVALTGANATGALLIIAALVTVAMVIRFPPQRIQARREKREGTRIGKT